MLAEKRTETIAPGAMLLRGFAQEASHALVDLVASIASTAPFRHMVTRGGHSMSVAMANCGRVGWTSDETGYRYSPVDPQTGLPWPAMPSLFLKLAQTAAAEGGFADFEPDACLINRYEPGARMGLHQDKDERGFDAPIVSVSLGLPATFLFGGKRRSDPVQRFQLESGDVVVWGGPTRLYYHGITALKDGNHPLTGRTRINLTFRRAL
ncbi:MAG: DNA oxidative demethylase AlkB [Acidobacteriota bacterium]|nr:DNA oxidative demethylase AlkB [Acidobacteriota bacterium]